MKTVEQVLYEAMVAVAPELLGKTPLAQTVVLRAGVEAVRAWTPAPEPTLGEIVRELLATMHTAEEIGEACACVGAERERQEIRAWAINRKGYGSVVKIEDLLSLLDARAKEHPRG